MGDNITFMNNSILVKVWRAGNNQTITETEVDVPKICASVNSYLDSMDSSEPCKVPLRTTSVLLNGAAKLYKTEVNSLLKECNTLDMEMAIRKTRMAKLNIEIGEGPNIVNANFEAPLPSTSNQNDNEKYSDSHSSSGSSTLKRKRRSTVNIHGEKRSHSALSSDLSEETDGSVVDVVDVQQCADGNKNLQTESNSLLNEKNKQTQEKGVQTNNSHMNGRWRNMNLCNGTFNENLPFGFVMVYDKYRDPLPKKVIFSSLNSKVKNL